MIAPRHLIANPRLRGRGVPRVYGTEQPSAFDILYNEADIVGYDIPVTCTRSGARKSVDSNTDTEVAANTADQFNVSNTPMISSMNGATNLVDTDLSNASSWAQFDTTVSETASYTYLVSWDNEASFAGIIETIASSANDRIARCEMRLVSGIIPSSIENYISFREAGALRGTGYLLENLSSDWEQIDCHVTSAETTDQLVIRVEPGVTATIEVRNVRAVDSTAPAAAFPNGSPANTTYGTDVNSCTPTFASSGLIAIPFDPYFWSDTGNPADAQAVIFEATGLSVVIDASGFFATSTGATSTKKPVSDTLSVIMVAWDGGNHYITVDDETPVSAVSAVVPSSTAYIGNTSAGTKPSHAAQHTAFFDRILLTQERTDLYNGYQQRLGNLVLR
jgi:hypothetical protein